MMTVSLGIKEHCLLERKIASKLIEGFTNPQAVQDIEEALLENIS